MAEARIGPSTLASAWLLASVPPLVKSTVAGGAFATGDALTSEATCCLAWSIRRRASRPEPCTEEALPTMAMVSATRWMTRGLIGAVAL